MIKPSDNNVAIGRAPQLDDLPAYLRSTLKHAVCGGLMGGNQYSYVAGQLLAAPGSLLIFGLGHDADLWRSCTRRRLAFVEDDARYAALAPIDSQVALYQYPTRVGIWSDVPPPPPMIARRWDYVLVDGPRGFNRSCPGRQFPIAWAAQLARRLIFVHDYQRAWERTVCDKLLGQPSHCVASSQAPDTVLAAFGALDYNR
jgi:hypothetical protein